MKKPSIRQNLLNEIDRLRDEAELLEVGSEEYLNNTKAQNQLAECAKKLERVDLNTLIPAIGSICMFIIYMIFSDTHIMDTRGIQFIKGLFRK